MPEILRLDSVEIAFEPWEWPFARAQRSEIDRHFRARQDERPGIWNGRVLLLNRHTVVDGAFRGACFETDYASFLTWVDWGFPDRSVTNFFAAGAVRASDGAYLLGEMAPHTANAGHIYFPCGTPEPNDLAAGKADLLGSIAREIKEETGLDFDALEPGAGWTLIADGGYLGIIKTLRARQSGDELRRLVEGHLAAEARPELSAIHIVRAAADLAPDMPAYVRTFLTDAWVNDRMGTGAASD